MSRRRVTISPQFLAKLRTLFPTERFADGRPSQSDFLRHELPAAMDALADNYEGRTVPGEHLDTRQHITDGILVPFYVLHTYLDDDGTVVIYDITV